MPESAKSLHDLAASAIERGDLALALEHLERASPRVPGEPAARLQLGLALERRQLGDLALLAYYRAIIDAQRSGRWLNAATTAPELLEGVRHAMRVVKSGRRRLFDQALAPAIARHGAASMRRVEDCLAVSVGERRLAPADPRQQASYLYFPGLPETPWFARSLFPWIHTLEREAGVIRGELQALLRRGEFGERVFPTDDDELAGLAGTLGPPAWNGFYFWRHGQRRDENHLLCPQTSLALEALPLVRIPGQAPEVLFSVLSPGTHILPHRGVTNVRVVCHLPLIVTEECALVVGGEMHIWREGEVVAFDDTFLHEAWNRGSRTRIVLIFDVWNPHLTAAEREGVTILIGAIDDFNRAASA